MNVLSMQEAQHISLSLSLSPLLVPFPLMIASKVNKARARALFAL